MYFRQSVSKLAWHVQEAMASAAKGELEDAAGIHPVDVAEKKKAKKKKRADAESAAAPAGALYWARHAELSFHVTARCCVG